MESINPKNGLLIKSYPEHSSDAIEECLSAAETSFQAWKKVAVASRLLPFKHLSEILRDQVRSLAQEITDEMGKPIKEAHAEILKCALCCDYYANHGIELLKEEKLLNEDECCEIRCEPLGIILGVMPWNFPYWQLFRFAIPALLAGNAVVLKHAHNVSGCAMRMEKLFREAGFPKQLFQTLLIRAEAVSAVIADPRVRGVSLTGSERAGARVAADAGRAIKKTVLELGGSDPFIVLDDADLPKVIEGAVKGRLINTGQSCIAAKRFIIHQKIYPDFYKGLLARLGSVKLGDPADEETDVGPLARSDLRETLHDQVQRSIAEGAQLQLGGVIPEGEGYYYPVTVLTDCQNSAVFQEETFGPVFSLATFDDDREAVALANASRYGLGGSVWSGNLERARDIARQLECGSVYINENTVSNVSLPFGGVKDSGYGRELSYYGLREFCNIKAICSTS